MELEYGVLLLISTLGMCAAGKYCFTNHRYEYCQYGCCGRYYNRYCCDMYSWMIALFVLGAFGLVAMVIIIVVCWQKKKRARRGGVRPQQPANFTTVTYVNQAPPVMYGQPAPRVPPRHPYHQTVAQAPHQPMYTTAMDSMTYDPVYPPPPAPPAPHAKF